MLSRGVIVLDELAQGTYYSIDLSERTHAQMRQDLSSHTSGASLFASSDRVFCRRAAAEHVVAGGVSPTDVPILGLADWHENDSAASRATPAHIAHRNHVFAVAKLMRPPGRPLTVDEVHQISADAARQWELVQHDPIQLELWRKMGKGSVRHTKKARISSVMGYAKGSLNEDPTWLLPAADVLDCVRAYRRKTCAAARARLHVSEAPSRYEGSLGDSRVFRLLGVEAKRVPSAFAQP